jgi:metal-responsive CopG/Arc/MetJ family transcriptional regulator
MKPAKQKLSITLDADVVREVDRAAKSLPGATRSSVIELWLRRAALGEAEARLRAETIAYYEGLSPKERAEERAMARAASRAAKHLAFDDGA